MKKKLITVFSILLISISFIVLISLPIIFYLNKSKPNPEIQNIPKNSANKKLRTYIGDKKDIKQENIDKKIEKLRKRVTLKYLISLGDNYNLDKEHLLALKKYLEAYKKSPEDESIIKKIGDTYFAMKKYDFAYKNYKKIKKYNKLDKDKAILSLFYHKEITENNFGYFFSEIDSFELEEQKTFYYKSVLSCIKNFHECKKIFGKYIDGVNNDTKLIEELQDIKNAIENYRNFKVPEIYYKNTLLVGVFFQNKLYPVSINLGKDILQEKPNYKPILQIIGKSYFELGKYAFSKKYLSKYYELQKDDLDVVYLLGIINLKLKDYIMSNLLLNKLLKSDYSKSLNTKRSLIFNYFKIGETDKMLKILEDIIENETETTVFDFSLSIHNHIINNKLNLAKKFAVKGRTKYPDEVYFYAYLGLINMEKGNLILAEKNISKGLSINNKNPMILLYKGILELQKGNKKNALFYLKKTLKIDNNGEFGKIAKEKIEEQN